MSTSSPGTLALWTDARSVDQLTWATLSLCPKALGVDWLSRATLARARGPAVLTNSPRKLKFGSEGPRSICCPGRIGFRLKGPRC